MVAPREGKEKQSQDKQTNKQKRLQTAARNLDCLISRGCFTLSNLPILGEQNTTGK